MKNSLFIDSLFVSYPNNTPREEKIPYTAGSALTPETLARLSSQILSGRVRSVQMEDGTSENALKADFRNGWATVYVVRDAGRYYELINAEAPDSEEPLNITGDGPTPKKHATRDMPLMAEIIGHFARTGEPLSRCRWEESIH